MFNNRIHSLKKFFLSGTWTLLPSIVGAICLISSCSNVSITHNMEGLINNGFNTKKYSRVIEKDKRNNHKIHDACPECNSPINTKSVDAICCGRCDKWYHFIGKCCGLEIENLSRKLIRKKLRDLKLAIKEDKYAYLCSICKRNGHCVLQETNLPITDETSDDNNEEGTSEQVELNTGNPSVENIGSSLGEGGSTSDFLKKVNKLTGAEKKIFYYLAQIVNGNKDSFTTGPVTKETLAYIANIEEGSVAPTVQKLRKKNLIEVYCSKSSKGGFVNYKLPINNIAVILDILCKAGMSREVLDMDYEYRHGVAKLTGHKKLIVCHLVSIVQDDLTAGPASIEDLLSIVGTTSNETVRNCMRELINTQFFEKEKGADYQYYKLNKKLIDSVKSVFPFYKSIKNRCSS